MNINDVKIAAEDLIEGHGVSPRENVYVRGINGAELINGFDVVETDEFTGVFVLDSSGKPAVSSRVVERKDAEIERLRRIIDGKQTHCPCCGDDELYYCKDCGADAQ